MRPMSLDFQSGAEIVQAIAPLPPVAQCRVMKAIIKAVRSSHERDALIRSEPIQKWVRDHARLMAAFNGGVPGKIEPLTQDCFDDNEV